MKAIERALGRLENAPPTRNNTTLDYARRYRDVGINVIPIRPDGSKAPAIDRWEDLQLRTATDEEVARVFASGNGIAAIGGHVSGNLEVIDFDDASLYGSWAELVGEHLGDEFLKRLLLVRTPRPGVHVIFRCPAVGHSQKLAMIRSPNLDYDPRTPGSVRETTKTLIETKGEGGCFLLPGCPPACHSTGRTYVNTRPFSSVRG